MTGQDKIIYSKLEKTVEFLCLLYKQDIITDAYIVGSIARGTAKYESDIDIFLINPKFEEMNVQLFPDIEYPNIKKLVYYLKSIGVKFEKLDIPTKATFGSYFQIYKGDIFHIMYGNKYGQIESNEYLKITKAYCNGNIYH